VIKLTEIISRSLFLEDKKLRVFDFDDTLVKTTSFIYITHKGGGKSKLTPGQYAVYKEKPGDQFDFRDFNAVNNPKVIKGYFELLKRMAADSSKAVYILTARAAYQPVYNFIRDSGIKDVFVVALGDNNPESKADWIEKEIQRNGYDNIYFVDDSAKNVDAVKRRLNKYPTIRKKVQLVKHG
jgi:phosphoglycolate phosphatase-like HAD superfamily hydrolase